MLKLYDIGYGKYRKYRRDEGKLFDFHNQRTFIDKNHLRHKLAEEKIFFVDLCNWARVCTGFEKYWKVMEIDSATFQDVESFGKWLQARRHEVANATPRQHDARSFFCTFLLLLCLCRDPLKSWIFKRL